MAYSQSQNTSYTWPTIPNFSNPEVDYDGESTGIANARNNARVLGVTAQELADYVDGNPLSTFLNQTSGSTTTGVYSFRAKPCGATGSYAYEWYVSGHPIYYETGAPNGTSRTFTYTFTGTQYVHLVVRSSDGRVVERHREVQGKSAGGGGDVCDAKPWLCPPDFLNADQSLDPLDFPDAYALTGVSPNPVGNAASLRIELPENATVRASVFDATGRSVGVELSQSLSAGRHTLSLPASTLSPGVYLLRVEAGAEVFSRSFVVAR
jgi:hypothetical protein